MIKPKDFDPNKKYPVFMYQYSGPGSQQVNNDWNSTDDYWFMMLTQQGYIVACVDGRGTGFKGAEFKKVTQKTFVEIVTEFRIKHACQMLRTTQKTMVEICFESGFGNLSHFNKQFKQWMKVPPLQYRKMTQEWV